MSQIPNHISTLNTIFFAKSIHLKNIGLISARIHWSQFVEVSGEGGQKRHLLLRWIPQTDGWFLIIYNNRYLYLKIYKDGGIRQLAYHHSPRVYKSFTQYQQSQRYQNIINLRYLHQCTRTTQLWCCRSEVAFSQATKI